MGTNIDKICNDIRKKVELALKDAAYEIAFEIESAYEISVDGFYNSYTPKSYIRNYYTYTGSDSYNNISKNIKESQSGDLTIYEMGIKVSGDYVQGEYKDPTPYVFNRSYFEGIHGTRSIGVMEIPPDTTMQMYFKGIKGNLGEYVNKSLKKYL